MTTVFPKIISFIMASITFLFSWLPIGNIGTDLIIQLESNPTTGYYWYCDIEDESILVLADSKYVEKPNPYYLVGVGGTQYFYFNALTDGETDVTFTYSRGENGEPGETIVYTVIVPVFGQVTYTIK